MSDDEIWTRDEPQSPCVKICVIHPETGLCTGCLRSLDEIATWGQMSAPERRAILAELPHRKAAPTGRRGGRKRRDKTP